MVQHHTPQRLSPLGREVFLSPHKQAVLNPKYLLLLYTGHMLCSWRTHVLLLFAQPCRRYHERQVLLMLETLFCFNPILRAKIGIRMVWAFPYSNRLLVLIGKKVNRVTVITVKIVKHRFRKLIALCEGDPLPALIYPAVPCLSYDDGINANRFLSHIILLGKPLLRSHQALDLNLLPD